MASNVGPAVTGFAAGLVAGAHGQHRSAVLHDLLQIALRGGVRPHLTVHGGRQQQRNTLLGTCQAQQTEQFIGPPLGQSGEKICATGRDQNGVGLATEVDVRHVVGRTCIPLRAIHGPTRQRLHGHRRDELCSRLGHNDLHGGALANECTAQLGRFVTGYASTEAQDDVFASKLVHRVQFSRRCHYAGRGRCSVMGAASIIRISHHLKKT